MVLTFNNYLSDAQRPCNPSTIALTDDELKAEREEKKADFLPQHGMYMPPQVMKAPLALE